MLRTILTTLVLLAAIPAHAAPAADSPLQADLVRVSRIWDAAPHNAFTDLVHFDGAFYCAFREAEGHGVSPSGSARVLRSENGVDWESAGLLEDAQIDLRDAKLSVTPDNKLMLLVGGVHSAAGQSIRSALAWFSADGEAWDGPVEVLDRPDIWLWRVVWHEGTAYGVGYNTAGEEYAQLFKSDTGRDFEPVAPEMFSKEANKKGYPNEAGLIFRDDDTAICVLRRDGDSRTAQLSTAHPPYEDWEWRDLGQYLGGPVVLELPDGQVIAAGRDIEDGAKTALYRLDVDAAKLEPLLVLPSGGDTSYPGLVWHDGLLWMSYYSTHQEKTAIYLAVIRLQGVQ